eukprot:Hpha_TRINITY_DN16500_c3_g1::TRINITY_DN16500_c3_g1_i1::g.132392::m.132392
MLYKRQPSAGMKRGSRSGAPLIPGQSATKYEVARSWGDYTSEDVRVSPLQSTFQRPASAVNFSAAAHPGERTAEVPVERKRTGSRRSLGSLVHGMGGPVPRAGSAPARQAPAPLPPVPTPAGGALVVAGPPEGAGAVVPHRRPLSSLSPTLGPALWLTNTLQEGQNAITTVVVDPAAAQSCERDDRLVPQVCRELRCGTPAQQVRTLKHFLRYVDMIHRCPLDTEEASSLFTVLFLLIHRQGGALTRTRTRLHDQASDLAFRVLCHLFRRPAAHTDVLLKGLKLVLEGCNCTYEDFTRRTELPFPSSLYSQDANDSSEDGSDSEGRTIDIACQREQLRAKLHGLTLRRQEAVRPPVPPPPEHIPFLQTLNCVDKSLLGPGEGIQRGPCGDLTERRFLEIFADFRALDHQSKGTLAISDIGAGRGVAMVGGINIASYDFFRIVDKDASGHLSLEELLTYWFPCVPQRFIRRRVLIALESPEYRPKAITPQKEKEPSEPLSGSAADDSGTPRLRSPADSPHTSMIIRPNMRTPKEEVDVPPYGRAPDELPVNSEACAAELIGSDAQYGMVLVCDDWEEGIKLKDPWLREQMDGLGSGECPVDIEVPGIEEAGPASPSTPTGQPLVSYQSLAKTPMEEVGDHFADVVKQVIVEESGMAGRLPSTMSNKSETNKSGLGESGSPKSPRDGAAVPKPSGQLSRLFTNATGAVRFTKEVARRVKDDFETLDIDGSGEVTFKEILLNGSAIGGVQVSREMFMKMDRDRSGAITIIELCRELFPRVPLSDIKATFRLVEAEAETRLQEREQMCAENTKTHDQFVEQKRMDLIVALQETATGIAQVLQQLEDLDVDERHRAQERALRRMRREEQRAKNQSLALDVGPCVPTVLTCAPFPVHHVATGVRVTKPDLSLDVYLDKEDTRYAVSQLLHTLDAHGVDIRAFTDKPSLAVPARITYECKVYREFVCLHQKLRPSRLSQAPGRLRWVRLVTNIRRRSSIKFRFHFEGHNTRRDTSRQKIRRCTVSTVVSGAAGFPRWPDTAMAVYAGLGGGIADRMGKDAVHHIADGLTYAAINYSSEQTVQIILAAPDLTELALTVSAWLVCNDSGGTHALTGRFETDEECERALLLAKARW